MDSHPGGCVGIGRIYVLLIVQNGLINNRKFLTLKNSAEVLFLLNIPVRVCLQFDVGTIFVMTIASGKCN